MQPAQSAQETLSEAQGLVNTDPRAARDVARRAVALLAGLPESDERYRMLGTAQYLEGAVRLRLGEHERAVGPLFRAMENFALGKDADGVARCQAAIGTFYIELGSYTEGIRQLESCLATLPPGSNPARLDAIEGIAIAQARCGDHKAALQSLGRALALVTDSKVRRSNLQVMQGISLRALGRTGEARRRIEAAIDLVRGDLSFFESNAYIELAEVALVEGALSEARELLAAATDIVSTSHPSAMVDVLDVEARLAHREGSPDVAMALLERALSYPSPAAARARLLDSLADAAYEAGRPALAYRSLRQSSQLKQSDAEAAHRTRLAALAVREETAEQTARTERIRDAYADLVASDSQRTQDLRGVVHDLGNALQVLTALSGLAESGDFETMKTLVPYASSATGQVTSLLRDFRTLLIEREMGGITVVCSTPVGAVVRSAAEVSVPAAERKGIALEIEPDTRSVALANEDALSRVVSNLVVNAVSYTPVGGRVRVHLRPTDEAVEIVVDDSGPGFRPDEVDDAFTWGSQLSARPTGGETSTGLGLFLVRRLVEAMNGAVQIHRSPLGGARVVVRLEPVPG